MDAKSIATFLGTDLTKAQQEDLDKLLEEFSNDRYQTGLKEGRESAKMMAKRMKDMLKEMNI